MTPAWPPLTWAAVAVPIANHLWQSTLLAGAAGLLTLTLLRHRARVRHAIWLAASVKFLVPFGALLTLGSHLGWPSSVLVQPDMTFALDVISQPFSRPLPGGAAAAPAAAVFPAGDALLPLLIAIWSCGCAMILLTWWARWRRIAVAIREASPTEGGREIETLRRLERICGAARPVAMVSSNTSLEPGVFGLVNPVLLWPRSVAERLDDRQVEAILSHELVHVRRHDNLTAAAHMVVEILFWFHPLVWWLGTRLVDERERACDEDVIRWGSDPQVYAESILNICRLYTEVPLACVSGVTGSDLKHRIERIMKNEAPRTLNTWRQILITTGGIAAIAGPVALGALHAPRLRAQSIAIDAGTPDFVSVSIKANRSGDSRSRPMTMADGRLRATNQPLRDLIRSSYGAQVEGGPDWLASGRFDIEARAEGNPTRTQLNAMLRKLLADRFHLVAHTDTRTVPVYALVLARSDGALGPQIRPSACTGGETPSVVPVVPRLVDPNNDLEALSPPPCGVVRTRRGTLVARGVTMEGLAMGGLSTILDRKVVDRTGLTGRYDLNAGWTPAPGPPKPAGVGPATFTALDEQLGLKLDAAEGPITVVVIDRVERPVEG
jgi:bla regulator protein BlaR1